MHNFTSTQLIVCHHYYSWEVLLTKFQNDCVKIVAFLLATNFWVSPSFFDSVPKCIFHFTKIILKFFKESLKILEKSLKFWSIQALPWLIPPLKTFFLTLPWDSRFFKVNLNFPLKFLVYPQPWKSLKFLKKATLTLN